MPSKRVLAVLLAVATLTHAMPAAAQDTHYWFDQFGNRALLLSGSVVADPADLSAVYYNPGGLALSETVELLLAGLVLNVSGNRVEDAVAEGEDLSKLSFGVAPSLIAGEIKLDKPDHRFAYSILTRIDNELRTTARADVTGADLGLPDVGLVSNAMRLDNRLTEYWAGGTWSYRARPGLGFGISTFLAIRNQRSLASNVFQALNVDNQAAIAMVSMSYDYYHWRLLWKIGAAGKFRDWDVGLTITTPSFSLFGSGDTTNNASIIAQAVDEYGVPVTAIATNFQRGLGAEYRSPVSVAFGAARTFGLWSVHLTAEYFAAIGPFTVVDSQPFIGQTSGESIDTAVVQELDDVVNVGFGVEREFGADRKAYAGFHTDFNAASESRDANLSFTKWDFYHVSGGMTFRALNSDFTFGGDLAIARDTVSVADDNPFRPIGFPDQAQVTSWKLTLLLGFNFEFK